MLTGDVFIQEGLITEDQLKLANDKSRELGAKEPIARVLVSMGFIQERDRVRCLGKVWSIPYVDISEKQPVPDVLNLISPQVARRFKSIPLEKKGSKLMVAMANPLDIFVIDELRLATSLEIEPMIAVEDDLMAALSTLYKVDTNVSDALEGVMKDFNGQVDILAKEEEDLSEAELREMGEDAPVIRLANLIINQAITDKASDIHIEPQKDGIRVRYRVDGVMQDGM